MIVIILLNLDLICSINIAISGIFRFIMLEIALCENCCVNHNYDLLNYSMFTFNIGQSKLQAMILFPSKSYFTERDQKL